MSEDAAATVLSRLPAARPAVVAPPRARALQGSVHRVTRTHDKLRRAQDLLRHSIPDGDPAAIFDRALTLLLSRPERAKLAATERPRTSRPTTAGSRHIPAAVRREVWKRDGGQCAFVGTRPLLGARFLEFHHLEPYAVGGPAVVENLALRCRAHNVYEAEQSFRCRLPLLLRERPARRCGSADSVQTEFELAARSIACKRLLRTGTA